MLLRLLSFDLDPLTHIVHDAKKKFSCAQSQRKSGASEEADGHENADFAEEHEIVHASHENGAPSGMDTTDAHELNEAPLTVECIPDGLAENGNGQHHEEVNVDKLPPKDLHVEAFVNGDSSTAGGHDDVNSTDMPEGTVSAQPDAVVPSGGHDSEETNKEYDSNAMIAAEETALNSHAEGEEFVLVVLQFYPRFVLRTRFVLVVLQFYPRFVLRTRFVLQGKQIRPQVRAHSFRMQQGCLIPPQKIHLPNMGSNNKVMKLPSHHRSLRRTQPQKHYSR
jgi:hypothetical protein